MKNHSVILVLTCIAGCAHGDGSQPQSAASVKAESSAPTGLLLFPKAVASRMVLATRGAEEGDRASLAKALKSVICDGTKPNYYPTWKVLVIGPPEPLPGTPLDLVANARHEHFSKARKWIQTRFFWEAATIGLIADADADYWAYPVGPFAKITAIAKPNSTLARIVELKDDGLPRNQMVDLQLLIQLFTFALPLDVAKTIAGTDSPLFLQQLGLDYNTLKFSPSKAISARLWIWERVLASSTYTQEAPQEDGTVKLAVNLNFGWFCAHSVALTDLVAQ